MEVSNLRVLDRWERSDFPSVTFHWSSALAVQLQGEEERLTGLRLGAERDRQAGRG